MPNLNTKYSRLKPILVATTITAAFLGGTSCSASDENNYPYKEEATVTGKEYTPEKDRSYNCGPSTRCYRTIDPSLQLEVEICTPREGSDLIVDCGSPQDIEVNSEQFHKTKVGDTVEVIVGKYGLILSDHQ